jgi:hypothetical protein
MSPATRYPCAGRPESTARDISAQVDFTGEEPGDATIRVTITFSGKYKALGVLGKPTVTTSLQLIAEEEA